MIPLRVTCLGALADPRPAKDRASIADELKSVVHFTLAGNTHHALLGLGTNSAAILEVTCVSRRLQTARGECVAG